MTKAGNKLLKAAREAVQVAKCDHVLIPQPVERRSNLNKFYCKKCGATIWHPKIGRLNDLRNCP